MTHDRHQHVVLNVPDVSCTHCKMAIEGAVWRLAGVDAVDVDVDSQERDGRLRRRRSISTPSRPPIEEEGYPVAGEHVFGAEASPGSASPPAGATLGARVARRALRGRFGKTPGGLVPYRLAPVGR